MWVDVHVSAFPGVCDLYIFTRFSSAFCISVDETLSSGTSTSFFGLETFLCVTYFTMCSFLFLFLLSFFFFFFFPRVICLFCGLLFFRCCYLFLLGITLYRWCSAFFFFFSFFWNWVIVVSTNICTYCLVIWTFSLNHAWMPSKISDFGFFLSAASLNEFKGLVRFAEQKEKENVRAFHVLIEG